MAKFELPGWLERQPWLKPVQTTITGGIIFMIPLLVIFYVMGKLVGVVSKIVQPIADMTGLTSIGGVAVVTLMTIVVIVGIAYLCGIIAKTEAGQSFIKWIENGVVTLIPAFNVVEGFAKSLGPEGANILVVLVPTDAGWATGLVFEPPQGEWYAVFLPGSPEWTSGSVSYAHVSDVRIVDVTVANLAMIMRRRGVGSEPLLSYLAQSKASSQAREKAAG